MEFNRDRFKAAFTKGFGSLSKSASSGLDFLLTKIESDSDWPADLRQIAYFLATIYWETSRTFQPIKEKRARVGTKLRPIQDRYWGSGYWGRGYIQLTWLKNYLKFGISKTPDLALNPEVAYSIAAVGMRKGKFSGPKLSDFFTKTKTNYVDAREIVNGTDKAEVIAALAVKIQACLALSLVREPAIKPAETPPVSSPQQPTAEIPPSLSSRAKTAFTAYDNSSEGIKGLLARAFSLVWLAIVGAVAWAQSHPTQIVICVLVLLLGYWLFHTYIKRQTIKTTLLLGGKV